MKTNADYEKEYDDYGTAKSLTGIFAAYDIHSEILEVTHIITKTARGRTLINCLRPNESELEYFRDVIRDGGQFHQNCPADGKYKLKQMIAEAGL